MMKTLACITLMFCLLSCKNEELNRNLALTYELGDPIYLQSGDSAYIHNENITIKFNRLVSDSRCPQGGVCVWAGEAIGEIKFVKDKSQTILNISTNEGYKAYNGYLIDLVDVSPYPDLHKPQPTVVTAKILVKKANDTLLKGTVKDYTGLDGCGFIIELDNGTKLQPINPSFPFINNQRIVLTYTPLSGIATICMAGQPAHINEIYELVEP